MAASSMLMWDSVRWRHVRVVPPTVSTAGATTGTMVLSGIPLNVVEELRGSGAPRR